MANQLTSNAEALRLFFTDDIYLVKDHVGSVAAEPVNVPVNKLSVEPQPLVVHQPERIVSLSNNAPETEKVPLPENWSFEYLGKNQKGILILVNDPINKVSSDEGTILLRNLVKAIQLTNNDFALVNFANYEGAKYEDLRRFFNCKLLLSFGVAPDTLGLADQPLHQLSAIGTTKCIFTANLHHLSGDNGSKKMLWATLQQIK